MTRDRTFHNRNRGGISNSDNYDDDYPELNNASNTNVMD